MLTADKPTKKVVALLIGINNYANNPLNAPLNDVEDIKEYLESLSHTKVRIKSLKDEEATKQNIVEKGFRQFLNQATEEDSILIYFSGHGTQEEAAFYWDETDEKLECIVCYDEGFEKPSDFLLADKEIKFLLGELYQTTKAHITVLMDCCHSGDNTRAAAFFESADSAGVKVKMSFSAQRKGPYEQREWEDFIFSSGHSEPKDKYTEFSSLFPEEKHIQFAACDSFQRAVEILGESVFTKNLLRVLSRADNTLNYENVYSRLSQVMRFGFEQTPRMYASFSEKDWRYEGFLNLPVEKGRIYAELSYNGENGWQINKGALHNVHKESKIKVYTEGLKNPPTETEIREVFIDYAFAVRRPEFNKNLVYQVEISDLLSRKIHLKLNNSHVRFEETAYLLNELERRADGYFVFGPSEKDGTYDYEVHIRNGHFVLTFSDDPYRPLIQPRPFIRKEDADAVVSDLIRIARWYFIKELKNTDTQSSFKEKPIELSVELKDSRGNYMPLTIENYAFKLQFREGNDTERLQLRIGIKNLSDKPFYLACLYLDKYFGSFSGFIPEGIHLLESEKTLYIGNQRRDYFYYTLDKASLLYNWEQIEEVFQFIVSEEAFDVRGLTFKTLPQPLLPAAPPMEKMKGGGTDTEDEPVRLKKWQTYPLTIQAENGFYNQVRSKDLSDFLEDDNTSEYAVGIYYDVKLGEYGQPELPVLKGSIVLVEGEK